MATTTKEKVQAREIVDAHLSGRSDTYTATISKAEYKKLCAYGDRMPADNESFAFMLHGERYHVNVLTTERSRGRGGDSTTYQLSRD